MAPSASSPGTGQMGTVSSELLNAQEQRQVPEVRGQSSPSFVTLETARLRGVCSFPCPPYTRPPLSPGLIYCSSEGSIATTLLLMAEQTHTAGTHRGGQEVAHSSAFTWDAKKQA